jgi:hypothetical protein
VFVSIYAVLLVFVGVIGVAAFTIQSVGEVANRHKGCLRLIFFWRIHGYLSE